MTISGTISNCINYATIVGESSSGNTGAEETSGGVSEDEVKGMIAKAMRDFAATLMAQAE